MVIAQTMAFLFLEIYMPLLNQQFNLIKIDSGKLISIAMVMIIIIDSNIFISALVKEGITRKLITQSKEWLIIPEYLFHEIRNHEEEIILKSGINKREYELLLRVLLKYIIINSFASKIDSIQD